MLTIGSGFGLWLIACNHTYYTVLTIVTTCKMCKCDLKKLLLDPMTFHIFECFELRGKNRVTVYNKIMVRH